jgi:macrolide transport system ATP-binding/permease protein
MAFIELRGVSRVYRSAAEPVHALREVDLTIDRGEFVAIIGPSGGGKTTLLSIIGGLDVPSSGQYLLDGEAVPRREGAALAALRARTFAFVFQGFHLLEQRPAGDSVALGMLYQGVRAKDRRRRAADAAAQVGMADRLTERTAMLSGGQRQRLAIARAIATESPVLLADEPTGNLDSATGARVMDGLRRLHDAGVTIIVVTHSPEVAAAASRVVGITDGRLTEHRTTRTPSGDTISAKVLRPRRRRVLEGAGEMLGDAFASLTSRGRQSLALAATVGLAIALLVTTLGITDSTNAQVVATFNAHANREVTASWSADAGGSAPSPEAAVTIASSLAGVDAAAVLTDYQDVPVGNIRGNHRVVAIHEATGDIPAAAGAEIDWAGEPVLTPGEALIGSALATQLELGPLPAGPVIAIGGRDYTVRGILRSSSRMPQLIGDVIVATGDVSDTVPATRRNLLIVAQSGAALQIGAQLPVALDPFDPKQFNLHVPTDPRTLRAEVEGGVQTALIAFTAISSLIAILTLMNSIGAAVTARRAELGLRRALGARASQLAGLVMTESALLGAAGGIGGLAAGFVGILGFTIAQRWLPVFDVRLAPLAVVAGIVVGALASLLGAVRAARVRPADALRQ